MCTEKIHVKVKSVSSIARPIIKLIQYILSRKVQLNSWQALIKPWDGFCGPLEVRTHPLPPPDLGASFSSFGVFVFRFRVLRFRNCPL